MKYKFIMKYRSEFRLGKMCEILKVSRSGYHNYVKRKGSQRQIENQIILEQINKIFNQNHCVYGSPRIYQELRKQGFKCNKKRVVRLMRVNGIRAKTKRKYKVTTNSEHSYPVAEDLVGRNFNAAEINKVWASDITYIWTKEGWLYLCCILDLCSRKIIGWHLDISLASNLVISSLQQALMNRGEQPGVIFHSDRGSQYASEHVRGFLNRHEMKQSMSRKGNCYDNAVMESFFHTLKTELVFFRNYQTRAEAKLDIFYYIEIFYNRQRSHSTIKYFSPVEFENYLELKKVA